MQQSHCETGFVQQCHLLNPFDGSQSSLPSPLPSIDLTQSSSTFHLPHADVSLNSISSVQSTPRSPLVLGTPYIAADIPKDGISDLLVPVHPAVVAICDVKFHPPPSYSSHFKFEDESTLLSQKALRPEISKLSTDTLCQESASSDLYVSRCPLANSNYGNIVSEDLDTKETDNFLRWVYHVALQHSYQSPVAQLGLWQDRTLASRPTNDLQVTTDVASTSYQNENLPFPEIGEEVLAELLPSEDIPFAEIRKDVKHCYNPKPGQHQKRKIYQQGRRNYFVKQMKSYNDTYFYQCTVVSPGLYTSRVIGQNGGRLLLTDIPAELCFTEGCISDSSINAVLSVSFEDDFPPMQFNEIMMSPVMQCGPAGETFSEPASLKVPHSANLDEDGEKKVKVWWKSRDTDWDIDSTGVQFQLHRENVHIDTLHFCKGCVLYAGPVDMQVMMLLKQASLQSLDIVYIKVLVLLKEFVKEACCQEKKNGFHVCSIDTTEVKIENNEKPLRVKIWNVTPASHWHSTEHNDVIPYEYLQKGRAKVEFSFRKRRRSILRIKGNYSIHQEDSQYIPNLHFDSAIIGMNEDRPPTPGYPNPPSNGSLGYVSASPGLSSNPGSVLSIQPPSVESAPPPSVQSQGRDVVAEEILGSPGTCTSSTIQEPDKNQMDDQNQQCSEDVTEKHLRDVADQLGLEWGNLATKLDFTAAEIERLYLNEIHRGIEHVMFVMLCKWKKRQPPATNLKRALANALEKVGKNDVMSTIWPQQRSKGDELPTPPKAIKSIEMTPESSTAVQGSICQSQQKKPDTGTDEDEIKFVTPDEKGYYTKHGIVDAWPSKEHSNKYTHYRMMNKKKGRVLLINISDFKDDVPRREGSEIDAFNMRHFFSKLGYEIDDREDLPAQGIKLAYKNFLATCSKQDIDSSIIVLMSYGDAKSIYGEDMEPVQLRNLLKSVNGTARLKTKPKMVFYLANQLPSTSKFYKDDHEVTSMSSLLEEVGAEDMFVGYMSTNGQMPLRKHQPGSAFIQALCEIGFANAHTDTLNEMCGKVSQHVRKMRAALTCADGDVVQLEQQVPEWAKTKEWKNLCFLPGFDADIFK